MEFTLDKKCLPNKDFVFTYTTADFELPSSVLGKSDAGSSAMLSFIPKFSRISIDDAYQASLEGKKIETSIEEVKGEYIFLLDRSYLMSEGKIEKAKEALILFIKSLPEDSYFNVVSFGSQFSMLFESSVRYQN